MLLESSKSVEKKCLMAINDLFESESHCESTHNWILNSHNPTNVSIDTLAWDIAVEIVRFRCRACLHYFDAWKDKAENGTLLNDSFQRALYAFLGPTFGTPDGQYQEPNIDHLEGFVGEWLWFFLSIENPSETIVHTLLPGFKSTDPGGDGLIIHRLPNKELFFRLWEMKKFAPRTEGSTQQLDSTVNKAYSQLDTKAAEYLARIIATEQESNDPELQDFIGNLLDLWIDASPQAAVGVSIATSSNHVSEDCFAEFGNKFPQFTDPIRLLGMLTGIEDFSLFAMKIKEFIWTGL
jgi:hypothetical protein